MSQLVDISGLNIRFTGERTVYAVNDLSLSLGDGEVLGAADRHELRTGPAGDQPVALQLTQRFPHG